MTAGAGTDGKEISMQNSGKCISFENFAAAAGSAYRKARLRAQRSQFDVSMASGIAQANISKFEKGKGNIQLHTLARLCDAVGCRLTIDFIEA